MKIAIAKGKKTIKMSRQEWKDIGSKSGWLKKAQSDSVAGSLETPVTSNPSPSGTSSAPATPFASDKDTERRINAENFLEDEFEKFEFIASKAIVKNFDFNIEGDEGAKIYTVQYQDKDKSIKTMNGDAISVIRQFNAYIRNLGLRERMLNTSVKDAIANVEATDNNSLE